MKEKKAQKKKDTRMTQSKGPSEMQPTRNAIEAEFEAVQPGTEVRPGVISPGGDIIIRLQQVELNQKLGEVTDQTQRANDISDQIGEAFNKMADQYESGWDLSRKDAEQVQKSVGGLETRIEDHESKIKGTFNDLADHIRSLHTELGKKTDELKGAAEYTDEQNAKQQKLLLILVGVAIVLSAASVVLQIL